MAGEELWVKPDAASARLDHPDHGVIGQPVSANSVAFGDRLNSDRVVIFEASSHARTAFTGTGGIAKAKAKGAYKGQPASDRGGQGAN